MYATQYTTVYATQYTSVHHPPGDPVCTLPLAGCCATLFPDRKPTPDQNHDSSKAKLGEPMSALGFIEVTVEIWKRGRINDSKVAASQESPLELE